MAQNDKNVVTEDKVTFRLCDDCLGVNLNSEEGSEFLYNT